MMLLASKSREAGASQRGQGLVEYAMILVLVAIIVLAVLMILGPSIGSAFSTVNYSLSSI